jgi:NADPH:quinone reductase-like Zn-dependent oxidoreductase
VLDPTDTQWRKKIGDKVDLVIDNIGGELLGEILDVLGHGGRVSLVGRLAGRCRSSTPRRCSSIAPSSAACSWRLLGNRIAGGVARPRRHARPGRAAAGRRPRVRVRRLPAAFERLKEGPIGKVLLRVGGVSYPRGTSGSLSRVLTEED